MGIVPSHETASPTSHGRRSLLASLASLALHGGLLIVLVGSAQRTARPPRSVDHVPIDVIAAPPPARAVPAPQPAPAPTVVRASAAPSAVHGRRGQAVPQRVPARPASARSALADLTVRYDDASNFAASADTAGDGDAAGQHIGQGTGIGKLHDTLAPLAVPPPPGSLASKPRPRHDYHRLQLHSVRQFAGRSIKVLLIVDERGRVRDVRLLQGVNADLDARTIALTRNFEFDPALDETGAPVPGTSRWEIAIVDDSNAGLREALRRGYY